MKFTFNWLFWGRKFYWERIRIAFARRFLSIHRLSKNVHSIFNGHLWDGQNFFIFWILKKYAKNSFTIIPNCQLSVKNETEQAQKKMNFSSSQNANKGHKWEHWTGMRKKILSLKCFGCRIFIQDFWFANFLTSN